MVIRFCFFFQAEDGIRDLIVTGVQTCALPIYSFLFDMRVLPEVALDQVEQTLRQLATRYEYRYKVKIALQVLDKAPAPPATSPEAPVAQRLDRKSVV